MGGFSVLFLFLFLTLGKVLEGGAARGPEGGYHYGYDSEKLYVHLVPHTHDDVGWLKTVDEYYYGGNRSIDSAAVKYILETVIEELEKDANRTFIYVEIAFFERWWKEQSDAKKESVKKLVSNKQLEFVNGGWCMNDEATTHYNAIIDQMTLGLQFIQDTFGADARPRVAWQIDPFGHSSVQAALFAAMGYDGLFFSRQDYDDHKRRMNHTELELVWRPSKSLGAAAELFTGIMYNGYGQPGPFCFDTRCQNSFVQDNPDLEDYNVDSEVHLFLNYTLTYRKAFKTNHLMLTFGSDFQYENARLNFQNMDKLMRYTNAKNSKVEVFYSTPSRYLDALHGANEVWPVKTDDFFPYADNPFSYWTGYFVSRPALKGYVREMNNLLQVCNQMEAMATISNKQQLKSSPRKLMEAMGVAQHHDAVSGTEKQHVAYDYAKRLHIGATECNSLITEVLGRTITTDSASTPPIMETCESLNISVCPATETNNFNIILYNPLGRSVSHSVVVPLTTNNVEVLDELRRKVDSQVTAVSAAVSRVRGKRGVAAYELYFKVTLPPLGFQTFFVREGKINSSSTAFSEQKLLKLPQPLEDIVIENNVVEVGVDGGTGRLKYITKDGLLSLKMDQNFFWYNSSDGNNVNSTQPSGAYIFRPNGTVAWNINGSDTTASINVIEGPLFEEVQQTFSDWVQQSIRVCQDSPFVEFDYVVGPIPFKDDLGKEIISRFTSAAGTEKTWFTDANGREMQERKRDFRPTWKLNVTEPVAGNYYPINSRVFMQYKDDNVGASQFTVLTDRSQGGASMADGQLEIMVHRRTLYDDKRGVGEPLNETGVDGAGLIIRGKHYVLLDNVTNSTTLHRLKGEELMLQPYYVIVRDTGTYKEWASNYKMSFSFLKSSLPPNVHLLSLKLQDTSSEGQHTFLLRLEHQFEVDEAPWNQPTNVSLADLFSFKISSVKEMGLAANTMTPLTRLQWKTVDNKNRESKVKLTSPPAVMPPDFVVVLEPMQIRTLNLNVEL